MYGIERKFTRVGVELEMHLSWPGLPHHAKEWEPSLVATDIFRSLYSESMLCKNLHLRKWEKKIHE